MFLKALGLSLMYLTCMFLLVDLPYKEIFFTIGFLSGAILILWKELFKT